MLPLGQAIACPDIFFSIHLEVTNIFYNFATDKAWPRVARHVKTSMEQRPQAIRKAGLEGRFQNVIFYRLNFATWILQEDKRNEAST